MWFVSQLLADMLRTKSPRNIKIRRKLPTPREIKRTSFKVKRSKVKVTRPINAETESVSPTNFKLGRRLEHALSTAMTSYKGGHTTCLMEYAFTFTFASGEFPPTCVILHCLDSINRPVDLDLWPSDLETGAGYSCDGFHPANFGLPRPFRSRVRSRHATGQTERRTDGRTDTSRYFIMLPPYRGRDIVAISLFPA